MSNVLKGQNLHDIAIQELGTADAAFDIALSNNIAVTDLLNVCKGVNIPGDIDKKTKTVNYYDSKGLKPATENRGVVGDAVGVNFWTIEEDFKIS